MSGHSVALLCFWQYSVLWGSTAVCALVVQALCSLFFVGCMLNRWPGMHMIACWTSMLILRRLPPFNGCCILEPCAEECLVWIQYSIRCCYWFVCCRSGAVCCWHYGFCWLLICLYTISKAAACSLCSLPCKMQGSSVQWHPKVCWVRAIHSAYVLQNECWPLGLMLMLPAALRFLPGCFMFSTRRQCFSLLLHCWRDHVCSAFAAH